MDIKHLVQKVFYINMNESTIRNEQSIENLNKLGLPIERIDAVTPKNYIEHKYLGFDDTNFEDIPKRNLEKFGKSIYRVYTKRNPRWRGDICCGLSHVKAILEAKKQGYKRVMICEDDFIFLDNESELFMNNIHKIPPIFDILHITSLMHSNFKSAFKDSSLVNYSVDGHFLNDFVFKIEKGLLGTGAYIINLENEALIKEYTSILIDGGISDCLLSFRLQAKYLCYTTRYKLGYQDYLQPTTIARTKGIDFSINNPRIKWLMKCTFNTPWTIDKYKNEI